MATKKKVEVDAINPKHYSRYKIQPIQFIIGNEIPYCEANVIKYLCRWRTKHKDMEGKLEDLKKAKQYIDILIKENTHVNPLNIL